VARFAAGLELLHAFLLVHDDVADRADSRRGGPSVHVALRPRSGTLPEDERQRLGEQLAIVGGDWLYTRALSAMLEAPVSPEVRTRALARVLDVCRATAEGQYADLELSAHPLTSVSPDEVLEIYGLKTGRYTFEAPLVSGALLAGASEATCAALSECALHLGIAFQIQDDVFGIFASETETGKPCLADLREAKKTWLLLAAFDAAPAGERRWLEELLARRNATVSDLTRVRCAVIESGAFNRAVREIVGRCEAARSALTGARSRSVATALAPLINWIEDRISPRLQEAA
jgi:geranylgeranyl diphosphate synthase type I